MSWNTKYVVLILGTTLVSYFAGLVLEKTKRKKTVLFWSSVICLGILVIFKYLNFILAGFYSLCSMIAIPCDPVWVKLTLPVGISFYTFQTMSYVIDVYRGDIKAEKHFGYYAAFISFFPQLVAGPIERTKDLLPQIKANHKFEYRVAIDGVKLMLWGYYKKIVVADTLAVYVDRVYGNPIEYTGFALMLATLFFTLQIYCDFSGYSDIAVGTAKLMGIRLMNNFNSPYFSKSLKEFWRRWHISLSSWFRDYVYIPMGGGYCGAFRHNFNLLFTFLLSGLWHGSSLTYIAWGMWHGLGQIFEGYFLKALQDVKKNRIYNFISWLCVFSFCVLSWVFFRSESISEAIYIYKNMFSGILHIKSYLGNGVQELKVIGIGTKRVIYIFFMIMLLTVIDFILYKKNIIEIPENKRPIINWIIYIVLAVIIVLFSQKGVTTEFVYFQF